MNCNYSVHCSKIQFSQAGNFRNDYFDTFTWVARDYTYRYIKDLSRSNYIQTVDTLYHRTNLIHLLASPKLPFVFHIQEVAFKWRAFYAMFYVNAHSIGALWNKQTNHVLSSINAVTGSACRLKVAGFRDLTENSRDNRKLAEVAWVLTMETHVTFRFALVENMYRDLILFETQFLIAILDRIESIQSSDHLFFFSIWHVMSRALVQSTFVL